MFADVHVVGDYGVGGKLPDEFAGEGEEGGVVGERDFVGF